MLQFGPMQAQDLFVHTPVQCINSVFTAAGRYGCSYSRCFAEAPFTWCGWVSNRVSSPCSASKMVKYGLDYTRCRWILPLLLGIGVIFGIIALAGRGWLESQTLPYVHQASLWESCSRPSQGGEWNCESLMGYAWGRAAAATYLVGFILLVICFALAIIAFAIDTLRFNFIRGIGGLLFVAAVFSVMGLVIYPVKFSSEIEMTGINMFSWAYGFGWTTAIMEICLGFFFCCLPNYEDQILGNVKPTYFYSSP
uniref:p53 apoptosis effector related to PMP-22 n=2 Tax=Phasianus colchicus TaxID=9054 RepID=A0A669P4Z2_PHACC